VKVVLSLALAFTLGAVAAAAQTAQTTGQTPPPYQPKLPTPSMSVLLQMLPAPTCPVRMDLRQTFQFAPIFAGDGAAVQGPAPRIRLILSNPSGDRVVKAKLTVVGWNTTAHLVPVEGANAGSGAATGQMSRTMDASFTSGGDGTSLAELELPGFSAARLVRLSEVTLADGTILKLASDENCQAAPSPLVLVTAR